MNYPTITLNIAAMTMGVKPDIDRDAEVHIDGVPVRGIRRIEIVASVEEVTTVKLEFVAKVEGAVSGNIERLEA